LEQQLEQTRNYTSKQVKEAVLREQIYLKYELDELEEKKIAFEVPCYTK
jgi:hypothetical protein